MLLPTRQRSLIELSSELVRLDEDLQRLERLKLLLNVGGRLAMKDDNTHTVLHATPRLGYSSVAFRNVLQQRNDLYVPVANDPNICDGLE
jgi:hypothetical protein